MPGEVLLLVCAVCGALVLLPHGFELQEDTCYLEADTFAILALSVGLSSSYMVLAIRWSTLLPIGIYGTNCLVMYTRVSVFNSGMPVILISLLFVGKRRLEVVERRFFMMVISEKVLRAKAEFQLAAFSTQLGTIQAIGQRKQRLRNWKCLQRSWARVWSGALWKIPWAGKEAWRLWVWSSTSTKGHPNIVHFHGACVDELTRGARSRAARACP